MARALMRIHDALDPEGTAIVPVFVPDPISPQVIGVPHQQATSTGSIACAAVTSTTPRWSSRRYRMR